ncbi:hypothetical protein [Nocardia terpenica]|uniref:hypothetical protein n=1 Tax=Nocardia terpenica TaxID=455432 RepID=UPI0002F68615|nr:hypothetical protein [Nocardia terpenica]NQE90876.1 hypothetical protein [Nocardia terpenica]
MSTQPSGMIRPEHATGGWELRGDTPERYWLFKFYPRCAGRIRATTPSTCAWWIGEPDGNTLREAASRSVENAKACADNWVAEHRLGGRS